jgi:hypothetical protein
MKKDLTIFDGKTYSIKLTFSVDENNNLIFPDDVEENEIEERLMCQIHSGDYGCTKDTINIFIKARESCINKNKQ